MKSLEESKSSIRDNDKLSLLDKARVTDTNYLREIKDVGLRRSIFSVW